MVPGEPRIHPGRKLIGWAFLWLVCWVGWLGWLGLEGWANNQLCKDRTQIFESDFSELHVWRMLSWFVQMSKTSTSATYIFSRHHSQSATLLHCYYCYCWWMIAMLLNVNQQLLLHQQCYQWSTFSNMATILTRHHQSSSTIITNTTILNLHDEPPLRHQ